MGHAKVVGDVKAYMRGIGIFVGLLPAVDVFVYMWDVFAARDRLRKQQLGGREHREESRSCPVPAMHRRSNF